MKIDIEGAVRSMEGYNPAGMNLLVYGLPKSGKTTFCASAADKIKTLFIDVEAGLSSTVDKPIKFISISSADRDPLGTLMRIADWLSTKGKHPYQLVVIDSLTQLQWLLMQSTRTTYVGGEKRVRDHADLRDWGINIDEMRRVVTRFRDIHRDNPQVNVAFTALEQTLKDEETGVVFRQPEFSGKTLSSDLCGLVDTVLFLEMVKSVDKAGKVTLERVLHSQKSHRYVAGDRTNRLAAEEPPDMFNLWHKIVGDIKDTGESPVETPVRPKPPVKPVEDPKKVESQDVTKPTLERFKRMLSYFESKGLDRKKMILKLRSRFNLPEGQAMTEAQALKMIEEGRKLKNDPTALENFLNAL